MTAIETLKQWFSNLKKPTQEQFWAWLDSFWHKSEKIPIASVEGLDKLVEGTASAEQLSNHLNDTQAHKVLFDKKVDKVEGKELSSNDFTNEYKEKLEGLHQVDISGLLPKGDYTGTAQDLKKQIDDKADKNHKHSWGDIEGSPADLSEALKKAVGNLQIGGRNLVRGTGNFELLDLPYYIQSNYAGNGGYVNETFRGNKVIKLIYNWQGFQCKTTFENRPMIISFWAKTTKPNIQFTYIVGVSSVVYLDGQNLISDGEWHKYSICGNNGIVTSNAGKNGFLEFNCTAKNKHIEEVFVSSLKFEYGTIPTDWTPAQEDLDFYKGKIDLSDLNTFKNRETGGYSVDAGSGWGAFLNFKLNGSTSSIEFFKRNWYPATRIGVRNSVDSSRFNDDNGTFRDLAWYDDVLRAGVECTQNTTLQKVHQNQTLFVTTPCNIELNTIDDLSSVSFRKVFDSGVVSFSCTGKNIIYTADNQFDGKKGSTAVISRYGNDCYIDIRNI